MLGQILPAILVLAASPPAWAGECPTVEEKMDAIVVFIDEHYGLAFSMIDSLEGKPDVFKVEFWTYEPEAECMGLVRVADDCAVSVEQAIVCSGNDSQGESK